MKEICFTTHYEPDPMRSNIEFVQVKGEKVPVDSDWVEYYFNEIERCRKRFPELIILAGIEVGYEMGLEGKIADFLAKNRFDYVLGAIHCLDHIAITSSAELSDFKERLQPRGAMYIARRYFDYVQAAAGSGLFDCLAHLDIWRKYITPAFGGEFEQAINSVIQPILKALSRAGIGLEINTSALRRGDSEPYPSVKIIERAIAAEIKTFTIGSDAHRVEDLGFGIERVMDILNGFNINPSRFRQRQLIL